MKPLLPPAPFTPSHPVFAHLADTAAARSTTLRAEAEEYIARIVKERMHELEKAEDELREQVDALWLKFKTTVDAIKKDREKPKPASSAARAGQEPASDGARPSPVAIKEFVPVVVSPARALSPPRISALSASLAASSFHHPRALSESHASARETNGSIHSRSSHSSERSGSATLFHHPPPRENGANVLQFPRNIDDNLNTAISFKYFVDLEYEMQRKKKERLAEVNREHRASQSDAGPSQEYTGPVINGQKAEVRSQEHAELQVKHVQVDTEGSVVETSERSPMKGKRHVTFDVEPEVVTIDGEAKKLKTASSNERELDLRADMIFELDEPEGDGAEPSTSATAQTLPLLEQAAARPVRHRRAKSSSSVGLPSSFSSLRPLSLPGPSQIRPPRSPHGIDASSQNVMMSLPKQTTLDKQKRLLGGKHTLAQVPEEELDPRDAVILRLVAADTPSHRGAWKPDSEAWKSLTQPRGSADVSEDEGEGEDGLAMGPSEQSGADDLAEPLLDENDNRLAGVPGSVPIPIAPIRKQKRPLSLASYQPEATLGTVPSLVSKHHPSAAALRRASYAERDRLRAMDPGALDFATEDDEEAGQSSGEEAAADVAVTETRSRRRALRILQKRSEIPEEGMWRSLAV
ncbi:hypothetical protein AX14_006793 [Amanita brunnescens Koide BX004]|nr:hypothetical protein AX14_006793 [Amanita brunnescens Koide BX004]